MVTSIPSGFQELARSLPNEPSLLCSPAPAVEIPWRGLSAPKKDAREELRVRSHARLNALKMALGWLRLMVVVPRPPYGMTWS